MPALLIWIAFSLSFAVAFGSDSDVVRGAIFATAAALGIATWIYLRRAEAETTKFVEWLHAHRREVLAGPTTYEEVTVSVDDIVARFDICVSALFMTETYHSAYHIVGRQSRRSRNVCCTLCTLLMGWWRFPFGPLRAVDSLTQNLAGGRRVRIGDLLDAD